MIIFIVKRFVSMIITLILLIMVGFSLNYFTPNAPFKNLDMWLAANKWLSQLITFNFGTSIANGLSISQQIIEVLPATIELCASAFLLALVVGIPWGMISAFNCNKWLDRLTNIFTLVGFSVPVFWLGLLLTLMFSLNLGWLPVSGQHHLLYPLKTITGFTLIDAWLADVPWRHNLLVDVLSHLILPMLTLALAPLTEVIKLMRATTLEVIEKSYIKAAIIRGLSRVTVARRHVLHNALPPIIPHLGMQFSTMLTLAMITEAVFNWPGIGLWLLAAVRYHDYASVAAGVMVVGTMVLLVNLSSDIIGAALDPIKRKEGYEHR